MSSSTSEYDSDINYNSNQNTNIKPKGPPKLRQTTLNFPPKTYSSDESDGSDPYDEHENSTEEEDAINPEEVSNITEETGTERQEFPESESEQVGSPVYIFRGTQNDPNELVVFSKLCQKYGLQNWNEMMRYLPWRDKASLRTALCRIIMRQALSEFEGIRADPLRIREDTKAQCSNNPNYELKAGTYVNLQWERSPADWKKLRNQNYDKYNISDEDAEKVEIPSIISIEYMKQLCGNRRQSLLLRRAALRFELAKRRARAAAEEAGEDPDSAIIPEEERDLGVNELTMNDPSCLTIPNYVYPLTITKNDYQYFINEDDLNEI